MREPASSEQTVPLVVETKAKVVGVPHGVILGPLLFGISINNMVYPVKCGMLLTKQMVSLSLHAIKTLIHILIKVGFATNWLSVTTK